MKVPWLLSCFKTTDLITGVLKMDKETAADTYKVVEASFNDTGIPTHEGIANIIKAIMTLSLSQDRNFAWISAKSMRE